MYTRYVEYNKVHDDTYDDVHTLELILTHLTYFYTRYDKVRDDTYGDDIYTKGL